MLWHVEIEAAGSLTDEQAEQLAIDSDIFSIHIDGNAGVVRISATVEADDYQDVFTTWPGWIGINAYIDGGSIAQPSRIVIEDEAAHSRSLDLIGAKETAERLGVTPARVRKLHERPDWPKPEFVLPGGEQIHRPAAIDAFNAAWDRSPGRPRKTA